MSVIGFVCELDSSRNCRNQSLSLRTLKKSGLRCHYCLQVFHHDEAGFGVPEITLATSLLDLKIQNTTQYTNLI
jgi:hypothetical protein